MMYRFGPFVLDLAACELRCGDEPIALQPRVFGMLRYLVEHRDRVVGKQELIDALWRGQQLNTVAVPWTINRARNALDRTPTGQPYIETVRGHGYRFVGSVLVVEDVAHPQHAALARAPSGGLLTKREQPFVGRDHVMARMLVALDAAASGHGGLFLLSGEAGIGKTRCADEFAALAARRGVQVWRGRCFEAQVAPAFWPFVQVLRAARADPSLSEPVRLDAERLLSEIEPRNEAAASAAELLPVSDVRFWLLDSLSRWLCSSAETSVRVVEIDDLHSVDESSLHALALLRPMLAEARLLLVLTARDVGPQPGRSAAMLSMRLRPSDHVELSGLRAEDVHAYLSVVLDADTASSLSAPLAARTAGNPLFLHEVVQVLCSRHERLGKLDVEDLQLPFAVKELVGARCAALDAHTRMLLDAACAVGEDFTMPVLLRATGLDAGKALSALQVALRANIVEPKPEETGYRFVHPVMREVLYANLSSGARASLHAAIGCALEVLGQLEPPLAELAHHFHCAAAEPYHERAARYGRLAGAAALKAMAYDEAVQFYAWALEAQAHFSSPDLVAACELLLDSALALLLSGRRQEGRDRCQRAIELARLTKQPELLIRAARQLRPSIWFALLPDPLATCALQDALALLPESATGARARAYAQMAILPPCSLRLDNSERMSGEAVRLARSTGDPRLLLEAQRSRLYALSGPESTEEQLRLADVILRSDLSPGSHFSADALFASYHALLRRGDCAAAERTLQALEQTARKLRQKYLTWHCERLRAQSLLSAGRLSELEAQFDELFARAERCQVPLAEEYRRVLGQALRMERTGRRVDTTAEPVQAQAAWLQNQPPFRAGRVLLTLERGETALARAEFNELAKDGFAAVNTDPFSLFVHVQLSLACVALDDRAAALTLHGLLEPHADRIALNVFALSHGCVAQYVARLDRLLGNQARARAYFERAVEINARAGHELARLRSSLGLAELLGSNRGSEDVAKTRALVCEVVASAERLGARAIERSAVELANRLHLEPVSSVPAAAPDAARRGARPPRQIRQNDL